jgi:hypothetical protein
MLCSVTHKACAFATPSTLWAIRYVTLQLQRIDGKPHESVRVESPPKTQKEAASRHMRLSKVVENDVNPEWHQEFVFDLPGDLPSQ